MHKGIHQNLDLDTTTFTGDIEVDLKSAYVQSLVAGKLYTVDTNGKVQIADGDPDEAKEPIGFLVKDAFGSFMQNLPALAGEKLAGTFGNCVIETDQIDTTETFKPGDKLYCGTGAKAGLVTKTPATGALLIGRAMSSASSAQPKLIVAAY